jgi:hypothetical protein
MLRSLSPILIGCLLVLATTNPLPQVVLTESALAQTPSVAEQPGTVLRLRVRVKVGDSTRGLQRKRFFLIKGSLEQNKQVIEAIEKQSLTSRDCYYRRAGASEALIKWLKDNDCESVYCRELQPDDLEGAGAVPEFVAALSVGEKELGSRELGRQWLTVNLPEKLRNGFYQLRQNELQSLIKQAEAISGARVLSVMTDRNGTAYFTDLEPGPYTLSNIVATETGANATIWNCEVTVKQDDRAFEKPFLIMNRNEKKDKNVKCVALEKPLPLCESAAK